MIQARPCAQRRTGFRFSPWPLLRPVDYLTTLKLASFSGLPRTSASACIQSSKS